MAYIASWPKCQTPENPSTRFQLWFSVNQIAPSVATTSQLLLGTMNGNATAATRPTASAIRCGGPRAGPGGRVGGGGGGLRAHSRASWGLPSIPQGRKTRTTRITAYNT